MNQLVTHCIAFLIGALTGAAGTYFGNKYTDRRREGEAKAKDRKQFREIRAQMPKLIAEIRTDLSNPEHRFFREFFVSSRKHYLNARGNCFVYYQEDHGDLQGKVHVLENVGYVIDITPGNAPKYRMTEEFLALVMDTR